MLNCKDVFSVCFIGHRRIKDTPELRRQLRCILITFLEKGAVNFIFGDHSAFNDVCYETVTELKEEYPAIKRIQFRKNYGDADEYTMQFLIKAFEESICPKGVDSAGRASYVERNRAMIDKSEICIFYYDESYTPPRRRNSRHDISYNQPKSGTALAYAYAVQKKKQIINLCQQIDDRFSKDR